MSKKRLMVIDGSSLIHRAFYALPLLTTKDGVYTNGLYGFLTMFYKAQDDYSPDYICVAFDRKGPTLRHEEYKDYKGTRQSTPSELAQQFPIVKDILATMNIKSLDMDQYEADDIAGTLARMAEEENLETILVTGDKDYLQLATDSSKILFTKKGISELEIFDRDKVVEEYGIEPRQLIDLKGLMGDKSDNIPGVPGIGEKTGLKLIKEYGDMETVYKNIDKISGKKLKENLIENESIAYMSRKLGEIIRTVPLDFTIEDLEVKEPNWEKLQKLYEDFELKSLMKRIPSDGLAEEEIFNEFRAEKIESEDLVAIREEILKLKKFSFKFLTLGHNYIEEDIIGLGLGLGEKIYYLDLASGLDDFVENFKDLMEDKSIEKSAYDIKADIAILFRLNIGIENYSFDPLIGQYLIDPSQNNYSINNLSDEYFNYYGIDEEMLLGKGKSKKSFIDLSEEERMAYLAFIIGTSQKLEEKMKELIKNQEMDELYYDIELPLAEVLASMEYKGFEIDRDELESLGKEYNKEIDSLTKEIHELAGREFNIKSPKQIGEVLFDDLGLPVIKKTKTGYSTSVEVLEKLVDQHPIIEKILRYRQVAKLTSTYIDGYIALINEKTTRIHSTFNQTITSTGRISSTEPNLQNIPIRTEDGRKIRKAFVADKPDYILLDADYSQIELRVLAHISQDEKMMEAFKENADIHTKTASEVFHVPIEEVTPELRNNAKAVNFGIVYGISDYGLSQDLNITRKEAGEYIDKYLENYSNVKEFMADTVKQGKDMGYVETLLHRRRYIPELKAKNFNVRAFGERIAMNTPIQGSAADIIKIAMVKVYKKLKERGLRSRLILQVHDELIIETYRDELEEVKSLLKETMESAIKLSVPLRADIEIGDNWYEVQ